MQVSKDSFKCLHFSSVLSELLTRGNLEGRSGSSSLDASSNRKLWNREVKLVTETSKNTDLQIPHPEQGESAQHYDESDSQRFSLTNRSQKRFVFLSKE